ncbi:MULTISPECIES: TonB family protein [unclassified Sphingomonas]|uniref:TonB family protein n=2 Tax=Pseudomonadota TaxID=1224 RepID=UPI001485C049|nr:MULTISPECIES: TonB family protein [unclassified Sphingomonas]
MIRALLLCLALAGAGTPALAAGPPDERPVETLTRHGKWLVDYSRDACNLAAQMGEGKASVIVRFTRYEPGDDFDFSVYGDRFQTDAVKVEGTADFGVGERPVAIDGLSGKVDKLRAMFFSGVRLDGWERKGKRDLAPRIAPEQEARATGVTLAIRGKRPLRLEFGSLGKPLAEMRKCMDALVTSWGYDAAQQAAGLRPVSAITSPGGWLNSGDYPAGALFGGHNGLVQIRLDVDPEGKVAGCFVLARTSPDDFADITCRNVARRAKLQPALDAQGKPMRSFWVVKVHWLAG